MRRTSVAHEHGGSRGLRRGRVLHDGQPLSITEGPGGELLSPSGEALDPASVTWLPPVAEPGTIFAVGLNYVDHASELTFEPPKEPLVFLKHASGLTGHDSVSYRPDGVTFQHYECELVAVLGKPARQVARADALDYVDGFTVCNDFAIRDYLENYYRPNLRVKSRDSLTPIGPWLVDVDDVSNLRVTTHVNGELTQDGNTRDMIFDVPYLIEHLSAFMTLHPGDMIATGTPKGVVDVKPGDVLDLEVEKVCRLTNTIVSEKDYYGENY